MSKTIIANTLSSYASKQVFEAIYKAHSDGSDFINCKLSGAKAINLPLDLAFAIIGIELPTNKESNLVPSFGGLVLARHGKLTLELTIKNGYVISDGWVSDWVMIDHSGNYIVDGYLKPKGKLLDTLRQLVDIHNVFNH